mmetsp:Transcript_117374/g.278716  ORF Transcript_117374/g.278716 Transcript_117374/m.278716 type:complete len:148 (-) Transcript_117374:28-471(-)
MPRHTAGWPGWQGGALECLLRSSTRKGGTNGRVNDFASRAFAGHDSRLRQVFSRPAWGGLSQEGLQVQTRVLPLFGMRQRAGPSKVRPAQRGGRGKSPDLEEPERHQMNGHSILRADPNSRALHLYLDAVRQAPETFVKLVDQRREM